MILPQESHKNLASLAFIFNKELNLPDDVFFSLSYHNMRLKYREFEKYVKEEKKRMEEATAKSKSKGKR